MTKRGDDARIERAQEQSRETHDERYTTSGDIAGRKADAAAARTFHEGNVGDAEHFADEDR